MTSARQLRLSLLTGNKKKDMMDRVPDQILQHTVIVRFHRVRQRRVTAAARSRLFSSITACFSHRPSVCQSQRDIFQSPDSERLSQEQSNKLKLMWIGSEYLEIFPNLCESEIINLFRPDGQWMHHNLSSSPEACLYLTFTQCSPDIVLTSCVSPPESFLWYAHAHMHTHTH